MDIIDIYERLKQQKIEEEQAVSLYRHVKELSILKYDSELRREDSLIRQSSNMQTAFSFMTVALFMAAPIIYQYRGSLSFEFLLLAFSSILFCLLVSLLAASFAQTRIIYKTFPSVSEIQREVNENWKQCVEESQQLKQWVKLVAEVQTSKTRLNNRRVLLIRISMGSFFVAVGLIILWYVTAMIITN